MQDEPSISAKFSLNASSSDFTPFLNCWEVSSLSFWLRRVLLCRYCIVSWSSGIYLCKTYGHLWATIGNNGMICSYAGGSAKNVVLWSSLCIVFITKTYKLGNMSISIFVHWYRECFMLIEIIEKQFKSYSSVIVVSFSIRSCFEYIWGTGLITWGIRMIITSIGIWW